MNKGKTTPSSKPPDTMWYAPQGMSSHCRDIQRKAADFGKNSIAGALISVGEKPDNLKNQCDFNYDLKVSNAQLHGTELLD